MGAAPSHELQDIMGAVTALSWGKELCSLLNSLGMDAGRGRSSPHFSELPMGARFWGRTSPALAGAVRREHIFLFPCP